MSKVCCYCKDVIHHNYFTHLTTCDGTSGQSIKDRRAELVAERNEVDRQIRVLTDRRVQIQLQIDDIDSQLPSQKKMKI